MDHITAETVVHLIILLTWLSFSRGMFTKAVSLSSHNAGLPGLRDLKNAFCPLSKLQ